MKQNVDNRFKANIQIALLIFITMTASCKQTANPVSVSIEQANTELWNKFVDKYGIINDFNGETPTPEDCTLGRPNAIGWWSPIENGPFFTGLYLTAATKRAQRTSSEKDIEKARLLSQGLLKCASTSEVPGFIIRGIGSDGKCHYPLGSVDQTMPWYLGLYSYAKSGLPTQDEYHTIVEKLKEVSLILMENDWKLPCDGAFKGEYRGNLKEKHYLEVSCYLFVLRMMNELTDDPIWLERYQEALSEKPEGSSQTRVEICRSGYLTDTIILEKLNQSQLWIYVKNQLALGFLYEMETDGSTQANYKEGLIQNAQNALAVIEEYKKFDNCDTQKFGHANWREGYPHWFSQQTQAEAEKLAQMGKDEVLGTRKKYERMYMTNPLAAAAIISLSGDTAHHRLIKEVITHYDYSKLHLSEFFFAELAYYFLE